jgi:phosphate transport system substrate-binding protein
VDWFSPENVVAVAAALLGLVAPLVGAAYQLRTRRGKRMGHRVQLDTAVGRGDAQGRQDDGRSGLLTELSNTTLVLLRIENNGTGSILDTDYINPDKNHGLTVTFARRTVRNVDVILDPKADYLEGHFDPVEGIGGLQYNGNTIRLPRVSLNEDHYYKLLVQLSGGEVGDQIDVRGGLKDGKVERTRSMSVDDKPPLFSRFALSTSAALALSLLTLAGIIIFRHPSPPIGCATGELRVIGSTAFAPATKAVAERYEEDCPDSQITLDAHGSTEGVRELQGTGDGDGVLALSDGPKPPSFTRLKESRVAVAAFALVVNDGVPLDNLTADQIREIYRGDVVNWSKLGGPDLPIRLVSRDANSGTRDLLRRRLLDNQGEPAFTSKDCVNTNSPDDKVIRCELGSTDEVLSTVARVQGAIGYSELRAATNSKGLHALKIDGQAPTIQAIGADTYRFTEIEYAYTNGTPRPGSLASSFLNYMIRTSGQDMLAEFGHLPCYSPEGMRRCQPT